jgi:hypothetical protein
MEKEMSSYTLKMIDQLVKLYLENKIDLSTLQNNLQTKLQLLNYFLQTGKVKSLRNEITDTLERCHAIISYKIES